MDRKKVYSIQDYIGTHLDEELTVRELAGKAALSVFHFHRMFKEAAGETPYDFIQRKRLERACILLSSRPEMKIIDVALESGFATPSAFSRAFRNFYRVTPSEFRKNNSFKNSRNGTGAGSSGKESFSADGYISDANLAQLYHRRKKMNARIEVLPSYRIAYMRSLGPYGEANRAVMQRLKKWALTRDLLNESSLILGIARDDPDITPADKCRYDTCLVIPENFRTDGEVGESKLPGGLYGVFPVEHSARAIAKAWEEIFSAWLPGSGYRIDGRPFFERYIGGTVGTSVEPLSCDICIPLERE